VSAIFLFIYLRTPTLNARPLKTAFDLALTIAFRPRVTGCDDYIL